MRCLRPRQSGLSLLEFTLVVIVLGVLVVLAFQRIAALRVDMERALIRHTVAAMREALAIERVHRVLDPAAGSAAALVGGNALALLDPPPAGYDPRARYADWRNAPPGTWFYDVQRGTVVYRLANPSAAPDGARSRVAAWRVIGRRPDVDHSSSTALDLRRVSP